MNSVWDHTYAAKAERERSWTESSPLTSLHEIAQIGLRPDAAIIDIGGGASRLVDALVSAGHTDVTVLDISSTALDEARGRLDRGFGSTALVRWIAADVTTWTPDRSYALWHDRAVFHFLVRPEDQAAYFRAATSGIAPGGHLIIAAFAPSGPETCSGLPVARWNPADLHARLEDGFELIEATEVLHVTPWGVRQPFIWTRMRRALEP